MATKIIETELDKIAALNPAELDLARHDWLQILVKQVGRPLGYCWLKLTAVPPEPNVITLQIAYHVSMPIMLDMLRKDLLSHNSLPQPYLPNVTVAICTRGRPESLERALKSLLLLDYPADKLEVLVVDNAPPDDATEKVVARFPQFSYVVEPRPGLDWARNRAIKEAQGEIIAYTDDDVAVDSLWLKAVVRPFEEPNVMCVNGLVAPAERDTLAQELFEQYNGFGKGFEKRCYTPEKRRKGAAFALRAGMFGTGANMAFRKSLFEVTGGFDESLGVGTPTHGGSDLEMYYRTIRNGYTMIYEPEALVWHYHRSDYKALERQLNSWGRGSYAFWTKVFLTDPEMRWDVFRLGIVWYWQRYVKRIFKSEETHRKLRLVEAIGALQGPISYLIARREANRIGAANWRETTVRRGIQKL
ncbi:glycosyltransferase [Candidatus Chlorohelix sp.]|uniref:glycosyltransferase n=1 Tax=Candidatus Chlorohelix sp. TaxID=3139201 RepID=UPI0030473283